MCDPRICAATFGGTVWGLINPALQPWSGSCVSRRLQSFTSLLVCIFTFHGICCMCVCNTYLLTYLLSSNQSTGDPSSTSTAWLGKLHSLKSKTLVLHIAECYCLTRCLKRQPSYRYFWHSVMWMWTSRWISWTFFAILWEVWEFGSVLWEFVILSDSLYLQRSRLHQGKHEDSSDLPLYHRKRTSGMGSEPSRFQSGEDYMHAP